MRKVIVSMVAFSMVLCCSCVFAKDVVFSWTCQDPKVTAVRVQSNGEDEGLWTVLDPSVTSYTFTGVDTSVENIFNIQSTRDGESWSSTKSMVLKAQTPDTYDSSSVMVVGPETPRGGESERILSYHWSQIGDTAQYNWFSFRFNDGTWYVVDSNTTVVEFHTYSEDDPVLQVRASVDGRKWTKRTTSYDPEGLYDEDNLPTQGWTIRAQAGAQWPFLAAFLIPKRAVVAYYNSNRLSTALSVELGASYETKRGNGYGFTFQYTFTPTEKDAAFEVYSMELLYSRMLYHTKRYEAFQLNLEVGLGPALCIYDKVGSFGFRARLGLNGRVNIADGLYLTTGFDVNAAFEPDLHNEDEVRLGTTLYLTLPLRVGLVYSFKDVAD